MSSTSSSQVPDQQPGRLLSLDVYRGLTIAAMVLVTDPGTYSATYSQLQHAQWDGATATDMIFPSFLFISGVSLVFSFSKRLARGESRSRIAWHTLRRAVLLVVLGLFVNAFPSFVWHELRLPGILQRIAVCYLLCGMLLLAVLPGFSAEQDNGHERARSRTMAVLAAAAFLLIAVYWIVLKFAPVPGVGAGHLDSFGNFPAYVDRQVFGIYHLWAYGLTPGRGVTYDPEGLLSTLPAVSTMLFGVLTGEWLRSEHRRESRAAWMLTWGIVMIVAGLLLNTTMPINKRILTPTFAFLSSGVALCLFTLFWMLVDWRRSRWWTTPWLVFGTNAIFAFVLSSIITGLASSIHLHRADTSPTTLHTWLYELMFATWLQPVHASLLYAVLIVAFNLVLLYPLYRRKIFLRL